MLSIEEYNALKSKFGSYSSWAVWDCKNEGNTSVIDSNLEQLHSNYVFLGLNISATLRSESWINFHGGKHDRKLKYACNDTKLRGSYLTDLFKDIPEVKSHKLRDQLTDNIIARNVAVFDQEMRAINLSGKSQFIILGTQNSLTSQMYDKYFKQNISNPVICHYHHSYYGITDELWVTGLWRKLKINENYSEIIKKYKK